jgi:hypothetical protein
MDVEQWVENSVIHLFVSDVHRWWSHIQAKNLQARCGIERASRSSKAVAQRSLE